jgi:hypothetical protein
MLPEAARRTLELSLTDSIFLPDMPTTRASYARVPWRYRNEPPAVPSQLVFQLAAELEPPLIKN